MSERSAPDWLTEWEYAHRGLHGDGAPENSLEGARRAIAAGMGVECDIQRSADGAAMIFHDWDLLRLTGTEGLIEGHTALEMRELRYLDSDEGPATLSDLLKLINGQVPLLVEIKSKRGYDVELTCKIVAKELAGYSGASAVMSFDPRVARWFRRHASSIPHGLVMREDEIGYTQMAWQRRIAFAIARPQFLAYHIEALPNRWVAGLRDKGLPILTWTVNSPETRARALGQADALISEGAGVA